jgi:hypothetical protein
MGRNPKLLLDPHRIPELYRFQHAAFLVCDVDAMMEHYAALIFGGFSEGAAGTCAQRVLAQKSGSSIPLVVEDIEVVE